MQSVVPKYMKSPNTSENIRSIITDLSFADVILVIRVGL